MEEEGHLPKSAILNCYMLFACIKDVKGWGRGSSSPQECSELFKFHILMLTKNDFWSPSRRIYAPFFILSNKKCASLKFILWMNVYATSPPLKNKINEEPFIHSACVHLKLPWTILLYLIHYSHINMAQSLAPCK